MPVKKMSIALDPEVAEAAAEAARSRGQSLSAWLNDAARRQLTIDKGLQAVHEWQQEHGMFTEAERASAETLLDDLLGETDEPDA